MKKLAILLAILLFSTAGVVHSQSANLTATVSINPIEVTLTTPNGVVRGQWFDVEAEIENLSSETIEKVSVTLNTPPKLSVRNKKQQLTLGANATENVSWEAKANSEGEFIIQVEVNGELNSTKLSASSDSIAISSFTTFASLLIYRILGV